MTDAHDNSAPRRLLGVSKHAWLALTMGVAGVLSFFTVYVLTTDCNGVKQAITMRKVERDIERVKPAIANMPGTEGVELLVYTGGDCGCMMVRGIVPDEATAIALRDLLAQYQFPYEVKFYGWYPDGYQYQYTDEDLSPPLSMLPELPAFK